MYELNQFNHSPDLPGDSDPITNSSQFDEQSESNLYLTSEYRECNTSTNEDIVWFDIEPTNCHYILLIVGHFLRVNFYF